MKIAVEGDAELRKGLSALKESVAHPLLKEILLEAAGIIRSEAIRIFQGLRKGHGSDPGNLERHMMVGSSKKPNVASAWFRNKGKHSHLFEFGHVLWTGSGRYGKMRARGTVRGYPFFRPAVDHTRELVRSHIKNGIVDRLNQGAKLK
jgi:hypothetical protein